MKTKNMCKVIDKFLTTHEHFETIELAKEIESQLKADFIEQDYINRGEKTTERDYYYYTNGAQSREQEIREMQMKNDELKGLLQISDKEILQLKNKLKSQEVLLQKAIKSLVNSPQIFSVYIKTKSIEVRVERNENAETNKQNTIGF